MIGKSDCFRFRLQAQKVEMNNDEKLMPQIESGKNVKRKYYDRVWLNGVLSLHTEIGAIDARRKV